MTLRSLLLVAASITTIIEGAFANPMLAQLVAPANIQKRGFYAGGGWSLITANKNSCPSGTFSNQWGDTFSCCPNGFERQSDSGDGALVCCQKGVNCVSALKSAPICASTDWNLWLASDNTYFCCLPGQQGTNAWECVSNNVNVAASSLASSMGAPVPTGAAASTVPVSMSTNAPGASITSSQPTGTGTKTENSGVNSLLSSALSKVSDIISEGNQLTVSPMGLELLGLIGLGLWTGLGLIGGVMVFLSSN